LIAVWGALEILVHDLAVELIKGNPSLLRSGAFASVRIPAKHASLDADDRIALTIEIFLQQLKSKRSSSVMRFEDLFNAVGLIGQSPDELRAKLEEMQHVRNLLVHRGGIADKKFRRLCPNIRVEVGQRLTVSNDQYSLYTDAIVEYIKLLVAGYNAAGATTTASSATLTPQRRAVPG
jgi:hypothetical protein